MRNYMFHSNIISIYGEQGKEWLDELPELVAAISSKLELRDLKAAANLTYNYVLSGFQGDNPIILKLGLDNVGLKREAFALKCFAGYGVVKVLAENDGMLLIERAMPGTSLKDYFPTKEKESIEIGCGLIKKLHQANILSVHNFPISKIGLRPWIRIGIFQIIICKKQESSEISCYKFLSQMCYSMAIYIMTTFCQMVMIGW
jgi:streptomycin 6-kinase